MASGAQAQGWDQPSRRRGLRYNVQAQLDVTVLRSGIPDTLPGRSVNLGEGGLAAVLAGELLPGEAVGVEIRFPKAADPLRTRALVRHHDRLRSGLEFVGMTSEQQVAIRVWAGEMKAEPEETVQAATPVGTTDGKESESRSSVPSRARHVNPGTAARLPTLSGTRRRLLCAIGVAGDGYSFWYRPRSYWPFCGGTGIAGGKIWSRACLKRRNSLSLRLTFQPK